MRRSGPVHRIGVIGHLSLFFPFFVLIFLSSHACSIFLRSLCPALSLRPYSRGGKGEADFDTDRTPGIRKGKKERKNY
jgi:hypothetical protein